MTQTKKLRGECQQCGQPIEFDAEVVGTTAECPHCGQPTELMLLLPADTEFSGRAKAIVFVILALVILLGGVGGVMLALKRAQRISAQQQEARAKTAAAQPSQPADPFAASGFRVSPVALDKVEGSSLVYATGTIANLTNRQRFSVRIELDLLDGSGNKLGNATDYCPTLEPNAEWRFRAQVLDKKTVSARLVAIKEDK